MRITVMTQMAKGVNYPDDWLVEDISETLESIKWYLWHGNVFRALQEIESLTCSLYMDEMSPEQTRSLIPISPTTASSFLTMASGIGMANESRQALLSPPSIR